MTTTSLRAARPLDERLVAASVLAVAAGGWLWLVRAPAVAGAAADGSPVDALVAICTLAPGGDAGPLATVAGWGVMVVAMMLPPAIPLLHVVTRLVRSRSDRAALVTIAAGVFVALWTAVGVAYVAGDAAVAALRDAVPWLAAHPRAIAGAVVVAAGAFQFSALKTACLRACRSPRGFALRHWRGARPAGVEVARLSAAYAASCVGCCWALMAVCFAAGTAALPVMVALSVVMAAERLTTWGRRIVAPAGIAAVLVGLLLVATDLAPALPGTAV